MKYDQTKLIKLLKAGHTVDLLVLSTIGLERQRTLKLGSVPKCIFNGYKTVITPCWQEDAMEHDGLSKRLSLSSLNYMFAFDVVALLTPISMTIVKRNKRK